MCFAFLILAAVLIQTISAMPAPENDQEVGKCINVVIWFQLCSDGCFRSSVIYLENKISNFGLDIYLTASVDHMQPCRILFGIYICVDCFINYKYLIGENN